MRRMHVQKVSRHDHATYREVFTDKYVENIKTINPSLNITFVCFNIPIYVRKNNPKHFDRCRTDKITF